jgi:hypothetical protein
MRLVRLSVTERNIAECFKAVGRGTHGPLGAHIEAIALAVGTRGSAASILAGSGQVILDYVLCRRI